ncbi:MAG: hypothetical protein LBQ28_10475 [Prevotellaceae bacterium]|jgi:hypothetical protein|nr:hypothetical protein [Prevotellaceae bacterium]
MNASNLLSIMKMEYKPSEKCLQTLQNIIVDKPWFAIGQQLLAMEIQRLGKEDFEKYLNKASIYSISRTFLYDRLFDSSQNINTSELQNFNIEEEQTIEEKIVEEQTVEEQTIEEQTIEEQIVEEQTVEEPETEKQAIFDYPVSDYFASQPITVNETSEDIIDKFLASSQKISIDPKNDKNENSEINENVVAEPIITDDFVTETLAKIYAEQGYISKAIEVYEKLSLQDSKKSVYFASLIENLKRRN